MASNICHAPYPEGQVCGVTVTTVSGGNRTGVILLGANLTGVNLDGVSIGGKELPSSSQVTLSCLCQWITGPTQRIP